jgi:hypothetical protein
MGALSIYPLHPESQDKGLPLPSGLEIRGPFYKEYKKSLLSKVIFQ